MEVKQIYELVNDATAETLGTSDMLQEDLSNLVDVGTQIFNANSLDKYVRSLVDHIGKVIFVNRTYTGVAPSVLRDGWEYGAVLEKITAQLPQATENESWELQDGTSYDPNIFYKPSVSAKFFNKRTTWEIPLSFTEMQARGSFSSASQMNGFVSMLHTAVANAKTIKTSDLIMRTINNMTAETLYPYYVANSNSFIGAGTPRAVNLLYMFNTKFKTAATRLTAEQAVTDADFIRYAGYIMSLYQDRLKKMSTLFNLGGQPRFTSGDRLHIILLSEFAKAAGVYLQSDTFHDTLVKLPEAETVPYWQGVKGTTVSGTALPPYNFTDISRIDVDLATDSTHRVQSPAILGVMFDRDALGVCNENQRVTTNYNPKAEFYTNWYKVDTGYFNDLNENFVVFYAADSDPTS